VFCSEILADTNLIQRWTFEFWMLDTRRNRNYETIKFYWEIERQLVAINVSGQRH